MRVRRCGQTKSAGLEKILMRPFDELPTERLPRATEDRLGARIQKYTRQSDINRLVLHNLREAINYAGRIARELLDEQTLLSVCYKELYRSAKRFRPGKTRFFAFSKAGIRGAIKRNWNNYDVVKNARPAELTLAHFKHHNNRLSEPFDPQGYENFDCGDLQKNGPAENFDFEGLNISEQFSALKSLIQAKLTPQEQMIITLVYKSGMSFVGIAELLEISRPAVQSTHANALRKLRAAVTENPQLFV